MQTTGSTIAVSIGTDAARLKARTVMPLPHGHVILGLADDTVSDNRPDDTQVTFANIEVDRP